MGPLEPAENRRRHGGHRPTWPGSPLDLRKPVDRGDPGGVGQPDQPDGLHLYGLQLTGEIPAELGMPDQPAVIWLQGNQLTGEIPAELGPDQPAVPLAPGEPVDRGDTGGVGQPDQPDSSVPQQYNQLTGEIPAELGSLTNLTQASTKPVDRGDTRRSWAT